MIDTRTPPHTVAGLEDVLTIWNEDCISGMATRLAPESVRLVVTSIPFSNLFMYSGKNEDVGNSWDPGTDSRQSHFGLHMRFFAEQLHRVMRPGCVVAIHVQQLVATKVQHGYMGRRNFRDATIAIMERDPERPDDRRFDFVGEIVVPKNPQRIAQAQKLHSLLFVTGMRDGRRLAPAVNDYVLLFAKPGDDGEPVPCLHDPNKNPNGWLSKNEWIRDASGVWDDIQETDVLEGWKGARDEGDEKHVCPLQTEIPRRLIRLYTNRGDVVMDPFTGIGTVPNVALELERRAYGFELKESYHRQALKNAAKARQAVTPAASLTPGLFDVLDAAV
jgi:DNA modification methylase